MRTETELPQVGATVESGGVRFRCWAPWAHRVDVWLERGPCDALAQAKRPMQRADNGYYEMFVEGLGPGVLYKYRLDGQHYFPDPASRFQPEGVHGPSEVVDPRRYRWRDGSWQGRRRSELVFYELHVGTFSPEGTYDGVRRRLPYLRDLGVTAVELMPVADFPGRWNWGYDPAALWAPSRAYGSPDELRALVDEAHQLGLAVFLDAVYNHFSPDGAYIAAYGPYLTDRHQTPWGKAVNLDGESAADVRAFLTSCALHWLVEYHLDGLRLDAVFALCDDSPKHWLLELSERVAQLEGPTRYIVAEDNRNLDLLVRPPSEDGYGLDGQWSDDYHHLLRRYLAGDSHGYFSDYPASTDAIAQAIEQGWYYTGQQSPTMGVSRGTPTTGLEPDRFVCCIQNHDQVGNRPGGDRLHHGIDPAAYRAASALLLLGPQLPLLFMGQEWGCSAPFVYFTDHNPDLGHRVRSGRREEFKDFPGFHGEVPDPQDPSSFLASRLGWSEHQQQEGTRLLALYRDLLRMRSELPWGGTVHARSAAPGGLVVECGAPDSNQAPRWLLVALVANLRLPLPSLAKTLRWQSEQAAYAATPRPVQRRGDDLVFAVPAAVVMEG